MPKSALSRRRPLAKSELTNTRSAPRRTSTREKPAQVAASRRNGDVAAMLLAQAEVLRAISSESTLSEMLASFAATIERQADGMLCSILLLEGTKLRHGAAPSLHPKYCQAVDGLVIGESVGSCGTAAYSKKQVIVSSIATDPLWTNYRQIALRYGLQACWSTPICSATGKVLGTFALYYRTPREPNAHELQLIETWTHLAALGIERKRAEESLLAERQQLRFLYESQEYERQLAAYEIHDGIAQYAAGAIMHLQSFLSEQAMESLSGELQIVDHLLRKTLDESRRLMNGLRPPILDECGIVAAIEHLIQEQPTTEKQIVFKHRAEVPRLAPVLETAIFRITQEAVTNAKKHSGSPRIAVEVGQSAGRIRLNVRDWGKGFVTNRVPQGRRGLLGIQERVRLLNGKLTVKSGPGKGTSISASLPILLPPRRAPS
jgi:signal transduction histidine kinase